MENLKKIIAYKPVAENELPEIELYMDQITSYLDKRLENFKMEVEDKILTKTMVNNYVKAKIVEKPIKKKYNRDHLMTLIMIFHLKNIVSINGINQIIDLLEQEEVSTLYRRFIEIQETAIENNQKVFVQDYQTLDDTQKLNLAIELILDADIKKRLGEALLKDLKPQETEKV